MKRYCKRFYCDERGDRFCCFDCYLRKDCGNPCLNNPARCGLYDPDGRQITRRRPRKKAEPDGEN